MTVVDQLDKTLFENFLKPKVTIVTGKLRSGILDPQMDWYETPQPTGERGKRMHVSAGASACTLHAAAPSAQTAQTEC
jgi:hypothetical protein